ncbi:MAG TPA: hypothetical protein VK760_00650 [Candidatus Acidoferrales bacterium]|nr:hypothetical protein [Candidatus Acidoferrales bacterium]
MRRILESVAATALIAGITGAAFGMTVAAGIIVSNGLIARGGALAPLEIGALGFPAGIVLYGVPVFAVVWLSRAKERPLRAVPRLTAGAIAGFAIALAIMSLPLGEWYSFQDYRGPGMLPAFGLWVALATLGTYAAACTIRKNTRT